jgi:predicted  nucleic acid-binding Zn-ribbon protein
MTKEINFYSFLMRLRLLFKLVKQISWSVDQTEKRYALPEAMTPEELEKLTKLYLDMGNELEDINEKVKKIEKEYLETGD